MSEIENYNASKIEKKWQQIWQQDTAFAVKEDKKTPKYYVLEMFPYPSGKIHMGHLRNYTIGDVITRYKKAKGYNVLHPMGWDAFGLPAENAAIENNIHPAKWTYENISNMKREMQSVGFSYDWNREFATCDPDYYKHEQKIFLAFYKAGLAYQKEAMVNWDPVDQTVLANEQVVEGRGWRSGAVIERKKLKQWFLKTTEFSEQLLTGLQTLENWPEKVKLMQEKWIGKSLGLEMDFTITPIGETLKIYTTRPDTIFGAAFCAISINHPLAIKLAKDNKQIADFIAETNKTALSEEVMEKAEKKGVNAKVKVLHPFIPGKELPLYIANFVLMEYGTGAIFGCPAHDQRDLDFALKYNLPVTPVVCPQGIEKDKFVIEKEAFTGDGVMINSDFLDGLSIEEAKEKICQEAEKKTIGVKTINYRLRDWGISRQRYWGCPIPMIHCEDCGIVPAKEEDIPISLPEDVDFSKGGNPLNEHPSWKYVKCPQCDKDAMRETDTFDTFFESSWYFARFCCPRAEEVLEKEACNYWLPVDQYIGGIEHAVLHLLYARFFTMALKKCGFIDIDEPFTRLLTQGMVCHETYQDTKDKWLYPQEVVKQKDGSYIHFKTGEKVKLGRIEKMSKSKKNVVNPQEIINAYGADTARLFMLSDSPPERDLEWTDAGLEGAYKYINRLWKMVCQCKQELDIAKKENNDSKKILLTDTNPGITKIITQIHKTIDGVTTDLEKFHLNKAIARIRELTNLILALEANNRTNLTLTWQALKIIIRLLNPMLPHLTEELWQLIGDDKKCLYDMPWPVAEAKYLEDNMVTIAIQINGKLRSTINVKKDLSKQEIENTALAVEKIKQSLQNKEIRKIIVVPNRVVNVVI